MHFLTSIKLPLQNRKEWISMERTNTKDIVSKVAYLIVVKKTVLYNQFETERPGYLK